jgi:TolB protein
MFQERIASRLGTIARTRLVCFATAIAVAIFASMPASAQSRQDLVLKYYQPMVIAVPDFTAGSPAEAEAAHAIAEIIADDLKQTGVFAPIDRATFTDKKVSIDGPPQFSDWQTIRTQELLVGRITSQPDNRIKVEFRLWDVFSGYQILGQQYFGDPDSFDRIGHIISAEIYVRVTGKPTFR